MAAPKAASRTLYLDTLSAQREVELLTQKIDKLDKKIIEGQAAGKKMTKEIADLDKAKISLQKVQEQIDKGLKPSLKQLEDFARKARYELKYLSQSDPDFKNKLKQYQDAQAEIRKIKAEMNGTVKAQNEWMSSLKSFGSGFIGGFIASIGVETITAFLGDAVQEITNAELASARLEAKLRNLGRIDAFSRLTDDAEQLARQFKFLDNDDILNVFSKLIDYGKLTEDQIKQLTPVIIDFAANQRISIEDAASVIIKALEGNGKELVRYGLNIKDAKDETEAFGIIMSEVKTKVEGSAEVFQKSIAGSAAVTKQEIANLKEEIGNNLQPAIKGFYQFMADFSGGIRKVLASDVGFFTKVMALLGNVTAQAKVDALNFMKEIKTTGEAAPRYLPQILQNQPFTTNTPTFQFPGKQEPKKDAVLGTGDGTNDKTNNKAPKNTKVSDNPRFKLLRELKQLEEEVAQLGMTNDQKEIDRVMKKYERLLLQAKNYADITIRLEAAKNKELSYLLEQITKKQEEERLKQEEQEKKKTKTIQDENLKRREAEFKNVKDKAKRDLLAGASLDILNAPDNKSRLAAEKAYLKLKHDLEMDNEDLTNNEKLLKEKQYLDEVDKLNEDYLQKWLRRNMDKINEVYDDTQQLLTVVDSFFQAQNNKEDAALQKELKRNDVKRNSYKKLLDQRVLSEADYNKKIQALNEEEDKKKRDLQRKQFNRQKAIQIAQVIISGAQAAIQSLANTVLPFPASLIGPVLIGAATLANVLTIKNSKPPEFERGGIANGSRHRDGGIDMIDRKSGRRVGNMEGGEPYMILSRNTYANNGDIIDELLDASMNRNGERIRPDRIRRFWETRPYRSINYSGASGALRTRYFERGGVVQTSEGGAAGSQTDMTEVSKTLAQMNQVMLLMADTVNTLSSTLQSGIEANVSLKKFRDAEKLDEQITSDSTFK